MATSAGLCNCQVSLRLMHTNQRWQNRFLEPVLRFWTWNRFQNWNLGSAYLEPWFHSNMNVGCIHKIIEFRSLNVLISYELDIIPSVLSIFKQNFKLSVYSFCTESSSASKLLEPVLNRFGSGSGGWEPVPRLEPVLGTMPSLVRGDTYMMSTCRGRGGLGQKKMK